MSQVMPLNIQLPVVEPPAVEPLPELRQAFRPYTNGTQYWRSLEEIANTPEFEEYLHREFPEQASEWNDAVSRRSFLKLMGASLALAGVSACANQPPEHVVPYVKQPENVLPGKPLFYATAMAVGDHVQGVLVRSNEGRPTKVEANPLHSEITGTDIFAQASILDLYDPDHARSITYAGETRTWSDFVGALRNAIDNDRVNGGAGVRILTRHVTSPTLEAQLEEVLKEFPQAKWHEYEPAMTPTAGFTTSYNLANADVILSIDDDFLGCGAGHLKNSRDFAARRKPEVAQNKMNRLYAIETTPTNTGAAADHRLAVRPSKIAAVIAELAAQLGVNSYQSQPAIALTEHERHWIAEVAKDLKLNGAKSLIALGNYYSDELRQRVRDLNSALGNENSTVRYSIPRFGWSITPGSIAELAQDLKAKRVKLLLILGGNPVYDAPANLEFAKWLGSVDLVAQLSSHHDETSEFAHWHVPEAHYLEAWSDARSSDGRVTIQQPLIAPIFQAHSAHEVLAVFSKTSEATPMELVRKNWETRIGARTNNPDEEWKQLLHDGVTTLPMPSVDVPHVEVASAPPMRGDGELDIVFRPDPTIYDGRYANNGWLQELPKPLTKLTWDNAAMISPATAKRLGLESRVGTKGGDYISDVVELEFLGRKVKAPIWILPGQPDHTVTVHLGYGRTKGGRVAKGAGFNAYALRAGASVWWGSGLKLRKTGEEYALAVTQLHFNMEGRDIVRTVALADANSAHPHEKHVGSDLYPDYDYSKEYRWGMAIDLNACTGCSACVVACQAENNIPVVGKEQVLRSREMHWLRIDRYYSGEPHDPVTHFMPVPCMQCEKAPCEVVCPVGATVHSAEGLNDMVYNRCVGTRYCSHNCPYKVRRFNFLLYQDFETPSMKMMRNPEVSVRSRGVMEKCNYCVQRITNGRIEAEKEERRVADGEVMTACQAACPASAITFGDLNDGKAKVSEQKRSNRNYALLEELNTYPRTTYLAAVKNYLPALAPHSTGDHHA